MISTVLKLCLFFLIIWSVSGADLSVAPVSMTAPLYTSVSFQCIGTGDALTWLVESVSITDLVKQERNVTISSNNSDSTLSSVLTINALPINDGIHIGCIIISFNPYDAVLVEVVLTIQGVTSIEDLTLNFTLDNYFVISWLPPVYHSDDVSAASLVYDVLVVNSNDALILNTTVSNTSVELVNITECDSYNVSVTAFVAQYTSITTTAVGKNEIKSCSIADHKIFYFSGSVVVLIQVMCLPLFCNGTVLFCEASSNGQVYLDQLDVSELKTENNQVMINYTLDQLIPFRHYNITIKIFDPEKNIIVQENSIISTHYIQDFSISSDYANGSVLVTCVFVQGLTTKGCRVVFSETVKGLDEYFDITGSENTLLVSLSVSGSYAVAAYNLINNFVIGPAIEYPLLLIVTVPIPSTSSIMSNTSIAIISEQVTQPSLFVNNNSKSNDFSSFFLHSSVIGERPDERGQKLPSTTLLLSITGVLLIIIIILILIIVFILCLKKKKKTIDVSGRNITDNPAYGHASQLAQARVNTKVNPAYSTVASNAIIPIYETIQ